MEMTASDGHGMNAAKLNCKLNSLLDFLKLGPVVRKPINANPQLKINRRYHLAYLKCFQELILS